MRTTYRPPRWFHYSLLAAFALSCFASSGAYSAEAVRYEIERDVVYAEVGGEELLADLYVPHGEGPFPCVLMVHGGAWLAGNKSHMAGHARYLADRGYSVVCISYRFAPRHRFPAQHCDCLHALNWMQQNRERAKLDLERLAGYGFSAGAQMVSLLATADPADEGLLALMKRPSGETNGAEGNEPPEAAADNPAGLAFDLAALPRIKAAVCGGTPCDFRELPPKTAFLSYWLGGTREELPDVYRLASPAAFVGAKCPPFFFFHGENDRLVPRNVVTQMHEALAQAGVASELFVVPETGHTGSLFHKETYTRTAEFLDKVLKRQP